MKPALKFLLATAFAAFGASALAQNSVIESLTGPVTTNEIASFKTAIAGLVPGESNRRNNYSYGNSGDAMEACGDMFDVTKDRAILDKEVTVGRGAVIGEGDENTPNFERPDIVNSGITVIGKRVVLPANLHVGRNVVVGPGVQDELLERAELQSGATVHPTQIPLHLFV